MLSEVAFEKIYHRTVEDVMAEEDPISDEALENLGFPIVRS